MSGQARPVPVPRWVLLAAATLLGLSSTVQAMLLSRLRPLPGMNEDWLGLGILNLTYWFIPALLAPAIMHLALRFTLDRTRAWQQGLVHLAGLLTYSALHVATMTVVHHSVLWALHGMRFEHLWQYARVEYVRQFDWMLMTYLFLVGLAHALAYRRESERRALESSQLETLLAEARLQSLQRQLHPHFLFNTLNTIAGLIRTNPTAADTMIDQLGDLLRMALHTSCRDTVPLDTELEALGKYLDIEQTRLGARLRVDMHIDPDTLDAEVPNLLLQPLVENAVRHGVAPHSRPGWVAIHTRRVGARLRLEVRDSGDGVHPESAPSGGVGLTNTRARLEHLYRNAHMLSIGFGPTGFGVTVDIPFIRADPRSTPLETGVA